MKKQLTKKMKSSSNAVHYFSQELMSVSIKIDFGNGVQGVCTYSCN